MTRHRQENGAKAATEPRALAAVCLGVLLAAATGLSAPRSSGVPRVFASAPPAWSEQADETLAEARGPSQGEPAAPPEGRDASPRRVAVEDVQPVDINRADASALQRLPGVGPALAERIVRHRDAHGPFRTRDDLLAVPGIGGKRFARLYPLVRTADAP